MCSAAQAVISGADEVPDLPFVIVAGLGFKVADGTVLVVQLRNDLGVLWRFSISVCRNENIYIYILLEGPGCALYLTTFLVCDATKGCGIRRTVHALSCVVD